MAVITTTYYTLNDCCTNQPINWPPNDGGLQGTLYLEFDGISCNEGDFNNTPCPNDLTNLIITEIVNEAQVNITGCLKLTSVSITEIPVGADIVDWRNIMTEVSTVPTCEDCQECCYKLTNCKTDEIIYSNTSTLIQHFGNIVTLNGQEGCWEVALSEGDCTCPIPVTVLQSFEDCPSCVPIIAYKFTNCNNQTLVQYSTEDYSAYVGKTVELECGDCWFVSQIDYTPPSIQTITILYTFDSCIICNRTYYKLVDCLNPTVNIVYTYSDLSDYLGMTIKIKGCDSCFTVLEETREPVNPGIVEVTETFETCPECAPPPPCLCSRRTNYSTTAKEYQYIDCNGNESAVITLQPNESTGKLCVGEWRVFYPETDNLEVFGNCLLPSTFNWVCPITTPVKKVKPGYSTPSCDIEKYEKITCKSSEIYYKQVMRRRYGISNCCPEEEEKWLVKKELIDLDALRDPDYICTPVTTCCSQPISSCGCGCNQTLKTCNS
jgi:hypothetical protein